ALLRDSGSGAVAVWASSGMTEPLAQSLMNKQFYQLVFGKDAMTLGEAVQKAKEGVTDRDVRRTWILFGDPTMRIK
ncbi:MAG TPA: C25 family cysteine peptidase, partial [Pyrinomonadaceae bacterium]|nr:C25 family cysteine peptidase [Pyrinomonadaceae bacterium]